MSDNSEIEANALALQAYVAQLVNLRSDELDEDEDLFDYGITSLKLSEVVVFMRRLEYEVEFSFLAENPTLREWKSVIYCRS